MINISKLPKPTVEALVDYLELDNLPESEQLTALATILENFSSRDIFDAFLIWHGFIGYTDTLITTWEAIKQAKGDS